jgi:hypothetical protein
MAGSSQLRNFNINIERRIHMVLLVSFIANIVQFIANIVQVIIIMFLIKNYKKLEEMWFQLTNKVIALKYQVREMHIEKKRILKEMDELKNENSNFMVEK